MVESIDKLKQLLPDAKSGDVILFFGAGMSAVAGCWTWGKLIEELNEIDEIKTAYGSFKDSSLDPVDIIQSCKNVLIKQNNIDRYHALLRTAITPIPELYWNNYIPLIREVKGSFSKTPVIVTSNVDSCLADTQLLPLDAIFYLPNQLRIEFFEKRAKGVYHIHGYKEAMNRAVFSLHDYLDWYGDSEYVKFIKHVFSEHRVVFVGFGLKDSRLMNIVAEVCKEVPHDRKPHVAIVPANKFGRLERDNFYSNYKVELVEYGDEIKDFEGFFIQWMNSIRNSENEMPGSND